MNIWFFTRSAVPSDLSTANPNPDGWGTPTAFYPSTTCDMSKFFGPQTMILEIDVCGNFAVDDFSTCSTVAAQCTDVVPLAANFNDAYFEIRYITVFANTSLTGASPTGGNSAGGNPATSVVTSIVTATNTPTSSHSSSHSLNAVNPFTAMAGIVIAIIAIATL